MYLHRILIRNAKRMKKPAQPFKWLLGLIVFAFAMGLTFSEVEGEGYNEGVYGKDFTIEASQ